MGLFNKQIREKRYFIYMNFGWMQESGRYDLTKLGLENLTLEEAQRKILEIKKKIKNRVVELIDSRKRKNSRLINWAILQECYIEEE